ncbi:MAG: hypothetical protein CMG39_04435 [Candidatus Marinimicrobia bacterium]|nr:hypothetical protein [Candidatus Neomarinimicrobiota bacterium]|tara:strand:+ start:1285 stop:1902 length:618 start_codon:yes stop_codon:yes gene_type:complete
MNIKYEKNIEIELKLLTTIEENKNISQRSISKEINVALGLTNSLVKKFVKKGFLKLKQAPMKRFLYYLTPQGLIEKSRLTQEYIKTSLTFFKRAKQDFEEIFKLIQKNKKQTICLIGTGEICEIAILVSNHLNVNIDCIFDEKFQKKFFYGIPIKNNLNLITSRKNSFFILCETNAINLNSKKFSDLNEIIFSPKFMMINRKKTK